VLVLDDGFQHRRLARDLDVVLLDALDPFGLGRIFPRGRLRALRIGLELMDGAEALEAALQALVPPGKDAP